MRFMASEVARATGGILFGPDVLIDGVSFDSRSVTPGQLFVAIVSERDGHQFIASALTSGAAAYLTHQQPGNGTAVVVGDTAQALMQLAAWARCRTDAHVVGVTGSVGKTSTKDLALAALSAGLRAAANERSFNNEQGLPVTILNAADDTEVLVLEMGMRGFGEITRLCDVARPNVGVVTRVAPAHTERVGDIYGVAKAKAELIRALPATGTAILNADDPLVTAMASETDAVAIRFGHTDAAEVQITDLVLDEMARPRFVARTPWGDVAVALAVSGAHMAVNAAAAMAVAGTCGVEIAAAADNLRTALLSPWRMEITRTRRGVVVINDAYNANPASMKAAIETLVALPGSGRRVAVLGVMAELVDPVSDHREIAELVQRHGIELVAVGTDLYGIEPTSDPLGITASLASDDAVLFKASRVAGLERLAGLAVDQ